MVSVSPWPILGSLAVLSTALNFLFYLFKEVSFIFFLLSVLVLVLISTQWWRDVIRESTFQGCHSSYVYKGLNLGMILFITSEVMFFFSFFFGFFFSSLNPDVGVGSSWPPLGVQPLSLMEVPFLNTLLLLSSGVSITWMHHSILSSLKTESGISGTLTLILGVVFMGFQWLEYSESSFSMADSVYGSFFFLMTGFHGIHVCLGVLFISVMMGRLFFSHFSSSHHFGFEASAWYWHFVDVVWLFLFISVYWWGS